MLQKSTTTTTSFIISSKDSNIYQPSLFIKSAIVADKTMANEKPIQQIQQNQQFTITCTGIITNCNQAASPNYQQQYNIDEMLPRPPPYPSQSPLYQGSPMPQDSVDGGTHHLNQTSVPNYSYSISDAITTKGGNVSPHQSVINEINPNSHDVKSRSSGCSYGVLSENQNEKQSLLSSNSINQDGSSKLQIESELNDDQKFSAISNQTNYSTDLNSRNSHQVLNQNLIACRQHSQAFHNSDETNNSSHRSSISSLESSTSSSVMPSIKLEKGRIIKGSTPNEILKNWLSSIKCDQYYKNFIENGYDLTLLSSMTPQDLTAIGCRSPDVRKKLITEIKKLKLKDGIPHFRFSSLEQWLEKLKLGEYCKRLCDEGYNTIDKICELTWEDLEEIGIYKLGHQKRLLLGIEAIKKYDKIQEERLNDSTNDVHPNHRMSLHERTLGRATLRSKFYGTRSGPNLDQRGVPVATVMPALKHVNNSITPLDIEQQTISTSNGSMGFFIRNGENSNSPSTNTQMDDNFNQPTNDTTTREQIYGVGLKHQRPLSTLRRNPPAPPVRTNSLKMPSMAETANNNSIYGNTCSMLSSSGNNNNLIHSNGPTTFLRTPKLGTLTATTNKMLQNGGHIETVPSQTLVRNPVPVREAPLPPLTNPPVIPEKIEEELRKVETQVQQPHIINHLTQNFADDEEFPPPPPMSAIEN